MRRIRRSRHVALFLTAVLFVSCLAGYVPGKSRHHEEKAMIAKAEVASGDIVTSTYVPDSNLLAYFHQITGKASGSLTFGELAAYTGKITVPQGTTNLVGVGYATGATEFDLTGFTKRIVPNSEFKNHTNVTKVTLPETITMIDQYAFYGCTKLSSINLPDSVRYIEANAFYGCVSLQEIVMPANLVEIGDSAFSHCATTEYRIYTYKNTEGEDASVQLTTVISGLSRIDFSKVNVSDELGLTIGGSAFRCTSITELILPEGLNSVDSYLCHGCTNLQTVTLPSTVTVIGERAFGNCTKLQTIKMPLSIEIHDYALYEYAGIANGMPDCLVQFVPVETDTTVELVVGEKNIYQVRVTKKKIL